MRKERESTKGENAWLRRNPGDLFPTAHRAFGPVWSMGISVGVCYEWAINGVVFGNGVGDDA